jgi:hypothetical protein
MPGKKRILPRRIFGDCRLKKAELLNLIYKNSLWGELNIQKRELRVKGIFAQDLGFPNKFAPGKEFRPLASGVG